MEVLTSPLGTDLVVRMVFGFIAGVLGIALWSHSREPAWLWVIAATLLGYGEVLLRFLEVLGVPTLDAWVVAGVPVIRVAFAAGIPLLYALGLWAALQSYRKP